MECGGLAPLWSAAARRRTVRLADLDSPFQPAHNLFGTMTKWLTSFLLVLTLGSGVLAGTPVHSSAGESGMMDCCKKALEQNESPHVAAARLCCAMNCNEPGSTTSSPGQAFTQTGLEPSPSVVLLPPASNYKPLNVRYAETGSSSSKPAYILNLALLI